MVLNQAYLFLIFSITGIVIGLLFDFFRILRKSFKTPNIITYIEDILFWILTGFILLYTIFTFSKGEIRLYMFVGIFIGCIIYMLLLSKFIIKINVKILTIIKKIFFKPIHFITINIKNLNFKIYSKIKNNIKLQKNFKKQKN